MNIHVILIAYALDITPLVESIDSEYVTFHLYLHSQIPTVVAACQALARQPNVRYHGYGVNRGLARSWNDGILEARDEGAEAIIVINDDVTMDWPDPWILAEAAAAHPEAGVIVAEGYNERMVERQILGYAVFAINPLALDVVGMFDINFHPIYFEDTDYSRRCALCKIPFHNAGPTGIIHRGSATVNTVEQLSAQNQVTFRRNRDYYVAKWGGLPGEEFFTIPFGDPAFGWQIAASQRHDPYPGRGRTDLEEVARI